ncbi:MAG: carbonic anhydrase [Gallionellaceae bacterium]|jgi:carbonic anhydrase
MKQIFIYVGYFISLLIIQPAFALDNTEPDNGRRLDVISFINTLKAENSDYFNSHTIDHFAGLTKGQYPMATVITCSDSRVQTNMMSANPEGKLFMIRNIGNQIATAEGSVEYGVHHLNTPVLLIVGHSRCGAISAATSNYSRESPAIKRELDTITISKDLTNLSGVIANVHNQVAAAMLKFDEPVRDGKLTVIGTVYDFADDLHHGLGRLNIINVNGEADPKKLANFENLLFKARPPALKKTKKSKH